MHGAELDISSMLAWEEGLPHPRWDLIEAWVESRGDNDVDAQRDAWVAAERQWLAELATAFDDAYEPVESEHFLAIAPQTDGIGPPLLQFAERCRAALLAVLGGVADFDGSGKNVAIILRTRDDYYRYVSPFFPEGEHGSSAGMHLREGFPHVALHGKQIGALENTLAHELTHVSLHHLAMPQWLEEGLAQMFEHDMTGRSLLVVDGEMARRHKKYWSKHGLDEFWRGAGFASPGKVQELSYQLAEIVVRLLIEEGRPRWFGWVREPQQRLFAFLREASGDDCGEEACRDRLGYGLSDLAAKFLGPGEWAPSV